MNNPHRDIGVNFSLCKCCWQGNPVSVRSTINTIHNVFPKCRQCCIPKKLQLNIRNVINITSCHKSHKCCDIYQLAWQAYVYHDILPSCNYNEAHIQYGAPILCIFWPHWPDSLPSLARLVTSSFTSFYTPVQLWNLSFRHVSLVLCPIRSYFQLAFLTFCPAFSCTSDERCTSPLFVNTKFNNIY